MNSVADYILFRDNYGLWFSYDDVNGVKFWENDPS